MGTFGDIGTWVGSIGTVGALGFTAYTVRRQIERDRRNDEERRREQARAVRVSIDSELRVAVLVNDSPERIYRVRVLVKDKDTGHTYGASAVDDIVEPGETRRFELAPQPRGMKPPERRYVIAQFNDARGYRWDRYMMGLVEEVGVPPRRRGWTYRSPGSRDAGEGEAQ